MWREGQMGFYSRWILPQVIELTMRQKNFIPFRERTGALRAAEFWRLGSARVSTSHHITRK